MKNKFLTYFKTSIKRFILGEQKDWNTWKKQMRAIVFTLASFYVITSYGIEISSSDGDSMDPNIRSGDILIIDKFFYRYFNLLTTNQQNNKLNLSKGDVIVATQPTNPNVKICKRILEVGGGNIYKVDVPKRFYWVQGDNKEKSYDSRHHGALPQNLIEGKVITWIPIDIFSIQYWTKPMASKSTSQVSLKK